MNDPTERLPRRRGRVKGQGVGVYSCPTTLLRLDKRSREGRLIRQVRADLTAHIGGKASVVQRMLIERAALLSLRLAKLDQKIADGALFTETDNNTYLAWSNSLVRTLSALGAQPQATQQPPSLADHLRARYGGDAA